MSDFMSRASLAGAVDLSSLRKPEQPVAVQQPAKTAQELLTMPSLVAEGNENTLKNFIEVSSHVAVIIEFYAGWSEQSKQLSPKLVKLIEAKAGRLFLLRFDLESNLNVAKAFKVGTAPTVVALLRGQPVPLFEGDQPEANLEVVFDRVLEIAAENDISQTIVITESDEPEALPALPPRHQAAFDAIDAGDYAEAVNQYELALKENPGDTLAQTGIAQTKLLIRTDGIDFEKVLSEAPQTLEDVLLRADACIAVGHPAEAFSTILTRFAAVFGEERDALRKHLLELFSICPADLPEVIQARKQLTALLY
jgi:putative thioredoxin